jgi:hypothetical protein
VSAVYNGDANFNSSTSNTVAVRVARVPATTTLTVSQPAPVFGQPLTLMATIGGRIELPGQTLSPGGSVTFSDGTTVLDVAAVSNGEATFTLDNLPAGTHDFRAVYSGDQTFVTSTAADVSLTVQPAATQTVRTATPAPVPIGQPFTLTATVGDLDAGVKPTGSITFLEGGNELGTEQLANGQASLALTARPPGIYHFTARYTPGASFQASQSADTPVQVQAAPSQTTLAVSPAPAVLGQPVTLSATVTGQTSVGGQAVTPGGTVIFADGMTALGTATLHGNQATCTTSALGLGSHDLRAVYQGDASFASSISADTPLVVDPPPFVPPQAPAPRVLMRSPVGSVMGLVEVLVVRRDRHGLEQTLLLVNTGGGSIEGPLYLVLDGLPKGAEWKNASGKVGKGHAHAGSPYLLLPPAQLDAGQSLTVDLSFAASNGAAVHFSPVVLVGPGLV